MFADKDYLTGEIAINYWELLGSLSYFIDESDVGELGINPEEYQTQRLATLNSDKMLLFFGQLPPNNEPYTHMMVQIKLSFDELIVKEMLSSWMERIDFIQDGIAEIRIQPDEFPNAFMSVARLVSLKMEDMNPEVQQIIASGEMVNLENEFRAMRKVHQLLQLCIDSYSQPREYIDEILSVHHSKLSRETYYRLRLHYFELKTLSSAQMALVERWQTLFENDF